MKKKTSKPLTLRQQLKKVSMSEHIIISPKKLVKKSVKKTSSYKKKKFKTISTLKKLAPNNVSKTNLTNILTPHGDVVKMPKEYPGDTWIHQNLISENNLPLSYYQKFKPYHFNDIYQKYWKMCYKKRV